MPRRRLVSIVLVIACAGAVAFLALRTSPYLQYVPWMPRRIGVWADSNGIIRNTAAFFALALVTLVVCRPRGWLVLALAGFGTAVEVAQIWIPGRVYDPQDIAASIGGVLLAWPVAWMLRRRFASR